MLFPQEFFSLVGNKIVILPRKIITDFNVVISLNTLILKIKSMTVTDALILREI